MTSPVRAVQPWSPQPWGAADGGSSTDTDAFEERFPSMRLINWIWHVRGSLELAPGQSTNDAFEKLAPLFHERGTSHQRTNDTLTFSKKDQPAQDKMSVFDSGALQIEKGAAGSVLHYHLVSRALLFCFMLVPLFLGIAQFTIVLDKHDKPATATASKKPVEKAAAVVPLNPVDKFLGAPEPEKPKPGAEKPTRRGGKPSATPAYVFASFFAILYVIGRILEDWLVKRLFRKSLLGS